MRSLVPTGENVPNLYRICTDLHQNDTETTPGFAFPALQGEGEDPKPSPNCPQTDTENIPNRYQTVTKPLPGFAWRGRVSLFLVIASSPENLVGT